MNQDIIDWLEGHWDKKFLLANKGLYFENYTTSGLMTYYPNSNTLDLGGDGEVYEVQIQDLAHLIQLEALL